MKNTIIKLFAVITLIACLSISAGCQQIEPSEVVVHQFEKIQLSSTFFAEGAGIGDLNQDGQPEVTSCNEKGVSVFLNHPKNSIHRDLGVSSTHPYHLKRNHS